MPKLAPMTLAEPDLSRLIEMAWEDRTPFDAIEKTFGLGEPQEWTQPSRLHDS